MFMVLEIRLKDMKAFFIKFIRIYLQFLLIENDSRNVVEGSMFFAIKGFTLDGTQFIPSAIEKGAKAIVVDETTDFKSLNIPEDVTLIVVPEIREAMAICACNFYDNPSRKFKLVGITGTKGKTTTTYMIN